MRTILLALLFLVGCATGSKTGVAPQMLEQRSWTIESYRDSHSLIQTRNVLSHAPWISFDNGMLDGASACGQLIGEYTIRGNKITIAAGSIITGNCFRLDGARYLDQGIHNTPLLKALSSTRTIRANSQDFALLDDHGDVQIVLRPRAPATPPEAH